MFPFDSVSSSVSGAIDKAAQAGLKQAKRGKVVARVNTKRSKQKQRQQQAPAGVLTAQDLLQLFQAMPVPNRGYKNPNASKPHVMGQGFDELLSKNPHIKTGPERQTQVNQEHWQNRQTAEMAGRGAVDFMKQTKGYTDANGKFVPPVNPIPPSSKYGTGSIKYFQPGEARPTTTTTDPLTGQKVPLRSFLDEMVGVQATKYGPGATQAGQDYFNPKSVTSSPLKPAQVFEPQQVSFTAPPAQDRAVQMNSDFDALFANAPMAPPVQIQTTQMPEFSNSGMVAPVYPDAAPYVPGPMLDPREVLKNFLNQFAPKSPVTPSHLRGKEPFSFPPML